MGTRLLGGILAGACGAACMAWGGPEQFRKKSAGANEATQAVVGEPVSLATGEFYFRKTLFELGGPLPLRYELYYGSQTDQKKGWDGLPSRFYDNHRLGATQDLFGSMSADLAAGMEVVLWPSGVGWTNFTATPSERYRYVGNLASNRFYLADPAGDRVLAYGRDPGIAGTNAYRIVAQWDRLGNRVMYEYTNASPSLLARAHDGLGRELRFAYTTVGADTNLYLARVEDHGGRAWTLLYDDGSADNGGTVALRALVDPAGGTNRFAYAAGQTNLIVSETLPRGNSPYTNVYEAGAWTPGIVARQTDALGQTFELQREAFEGTFGETTRFSAVHPDGTRQTVSHKRGTVLSTLVDEAGGQVEFGVPFPDQVESMTDRLGATTRVTYDFSSGKVSSFTDSLGQTTTLGYTNSVQILTDPDNGTPVRFTFYDLRSVLYADGTRETWVVASNGLRRAATDRATNTTFFAYNALGQPVAVTNPAGGVLSFGYDASGNATTYGDSDAGVWTNAYDGWSRLVRTTAADGTFRAFEFDALDRITNVVTEGGATLRFSYDANGGMTGRIAAAGTTLAATNTWAYDALDREVAAVNPLGNRLQHAYTWWGGVSSLVFADGARLAFRYGPGRAPAGVVDESGRTLAVTTDAEGRPVAARTPAGRSVALTLNAMGRTVALTDPAGGRTTFQRDGLQRITNAVDALNRPVSIGYDGEGRVRRVTLPVIGSATYAFDRNGALTNATDPRGQAWTLMRTPMGRLAGLRDPDGNAWAWTLDALGRIAVVVAPDGGGMTNRYDAAGRLTNQTHSAGPALTYAYDALGRLRSTGGIGVECEYDRGGRITNTVFNGARLGVAYDSRDRIAALDYDGRMTVQYSYDLRGLVTQVTDSATASWIGLEYDDDRLLVRITRSNGVATDLARNANGAVTNLSHGGKGSIAVRRDAVGRVAEFVQDLPLDVQALVADEVQAFAHDASGRINAAGFAFDARGRRVRDPQRGYTWDAAGRLTSISNATGVVTNEYTALGDLARQSRPGATNEYVHQYAMPGRPVLAEKRNGSYVRLYVHRPDGRLLYHVDVSGAPAPRFHHFNPAGTTLFLTDGAGHITDSYGYTVYGRLLQHNGPSGQPFGYIGELGVREEAGTSLVQMRARWYDMLTARFLSRDPLWLDTSGDPLQMSPYTYAVGDPLQFSDPSGLAPPGANHVVKQMDPPAGDGARVPDDVQAIIDWMHRLDAADPARGRHVPSAGVLDDQDRGLGSVPMPTGTGSDKYRRMIQSPMERALQDRNQRMRKRRADLVEDIARMYVDQALPDNRVSCRDEECERRELQDEITQYVLANPQDSADALYKEGRQKGEARVRMHMGIKSLLDPARLREAAAVAVRSPAGILLGLWLAVRLAWWAARRRGT